jgi:hypothetical protein
VSPPPRRFLPPASLPPADHLCASLPHPTPPSTPPTSTFTSTYPHTHRLPTAQLEELLADEAKFKEVLREAVAASGVRRCALGGGGGVGG